MLILYCVGLTTDVANARPLRQATAQNRSGRKRISIYCIQWARTLPEQIGGQRRFWADPCIKPVFSNKHSSHFKISSAAAPWPQCYVMLVRDTCNSAEMICGYGGGPERKGRSRQARHASPQCTPSRHQELTPPGSARAQGSERSPARSGTEMPRGPAPESCSPPGR
jgi:hypothetical protein